MSDEEKEPESAKSRLTSNLGKLSEVAKDTAKQGMQKVGDKALETAKAGAAVMGEKTKELTEKGMKKLEEKAQEVIAKSISVEMEPENINRSKKALDSHSGGGSDGRFNKHTSNFQEQNKHSGKNQRGRLAKFESNIGDTGRNLENQMSTWYGWFWSTIAYMFVIMISFVISSTDGRFALLPIVLIVGFPFFLYYAIVSSIPEIRMGNRVLFSRRDLSLRNQLTFTSRVARTFSREMIQSSPMGAFFIYGFLFLLVAVLILPFLQPA